ncbi:MAG TPA: hypothetical protein QGG18_04645 [Rhodospirillales bacterium]|nr:hypothetical protein [Rhodospirillales bacterium]
MKNTDTQPTLQDRAVDSANLQVRASGRHRRRGCGVARNQW